MVPKDIFYLDASGIKGQCDQLCGIAFTKNSILLGNDGLNAYRSAKTGNPLKPESFTDGRFAMVLSLGKKVFIFTDPLGQELLFYYQREDYWAVSNSFLYLCQRLKDRINIALDPVSFSSFFVANQGLFGGQILFPQMPIFGVRLLEANKMIVINREAPDLLKIMPIDRKPKDLTYEKALGMFLSETRGRLKALMDNAFDGLVVDLSGGYDSRINFGLLIDAGISNTKIKVNSSSIKTRDHEIATWIQSNIHSFTGDFRTVDRKLTSEQAYAIWKLGNVGIYLSINPPRNQGWTSILKIHGGSFKGRSYISKTPNQLLGRFFLKKIPSHLQKPFSRMFLKMFGGVGPRYSKSTMANHYRDYRARFHYGRAWYRNLIQTTLTPLLSNTLMWASSLQSFADYQKSQLESDLLTLISPRLADISFDKESKAFTKDVREKSLALRASINGIEPSHIDYRVFGTVAGNSFQEQPKKDKSGKPFSELLKQDYLSSVEYVKETNLVPERFFTQAEQELCTIENLGNSVKAISMIVSAAELLKLTDGRIQSVQQYSLPYRIYLSATFQRHKMNSYVQVRNKTA